MCYNGCKRRVQFWTGGAAFLLALVMFLVASVPVSSGLTLHPSVYYSVVSLEPGMDLKALAARYHTTVAEILKDNAKDSPFLVGDTLVIRENTLAEQVSRGSGTAWYWPLVGPITQGYGWQGGDFHHGLDLGVPTGTPVRAAYAGRVVRADRFGVYGQVVIIDHGRGLQTLYAHNSRLLVRVGQAVAGGDIIAVSGSTGRTTGPHLHFEVRVDGQTVEPMAYLPKLKVASE